MGIDGRTAFREACIFHCMKHQRPTMLWNLFMTEFHIYLMDQLARKLGV